MLFNIRMVKALHGSCKEISCLCVHEAVKNSKTAEKPRPKAMPCGTLRALAARENLIGNCRTSAATEVWGSCCLRLRPQRWQQACWEIEACKLGSLEEHERRTCRGPATGWSPRQAAVLENWSCAGERSVRRARLGRASADGVPKQYGST